MMPIFRNDQILKMNLWPGLSEKFEFLMQSFKLMRRTQLYLEPKSQIFGFLTFQYAFKI